MDNVGREKYTVTITLALDILIRTEGGIHENQQYTYGNCGSRGGRKQTGRMGNIFLRNGREAPKEAPKKMRQ